jgi:hypothetical protein
VDEGVGSFVSSQSSEVHLTFIWEMVMVGGGAVAGQDPEPKAISRVIGQTRWASFSTLASSSRSLPFSTFVLYKNCPPIVLGSLSSVYSVRCILFAPCRRLSRSAASIQISSLAALPA